VNAHVCLPTNDRLPAGLGFRVKVLGFLLLHLNLPFLLKLARLSLTLNRLCDPNSSFASGGTLLALSLTSIIQTRHTSHEPVSQAPHQNSVVSRCWF
jgi:hypothetical protein